MSHNSRFRPGPTLDECEKQGMTHLRLVCHGWDCTRRDVVIEVGKIRARRDVPVNHIRWRCERANGGCGGINITVEAIKPKPEEIPHPIFDVKQMKPRPRRKLRYF